MPTAEEILQSSLRGIDLPTATSAASTEYFFFWSNTNNRLEKLLKSNINTNPYFSYDAFGLIPSAGSTTTDQEIEDKINSTGFTIAAGEVKFLQCNVIINNVVHVRVYQYLPNAAGTYGTAAANEIAFSNLFKLEELVLSQNLDTVTTIALGDIGSDSIEDYINANDDDDWNLLYKVIYIFTATISSVDYQYLYVGVQPQYIGDSYNSVTSDDFLELSGANLSGVNIEGTDILSTGEAGGSKFLREDGDGTCSWQSIPTASAPIPTAYANLATLLAAQGAQTTGYIYEVTDGSGFTGVDSGIVWVKYKGTTTGDETDYTWESRPSGGGSSTVTEDTGTTITFTQDTFWNNKSPLTSGALTLDLTSAVLGASGWVWCDKYTPSISGENYEISSGSFSSTKMNLLQFTVVELDADPNPRLDLKIANIAYLSAPIPSTVTESIAEQITLNNFGVINATSYSIYRNTVENEYANEAAMLADQGAQTTGLLNLLQDTGVYYEKTASSTADISDYTQITTTEKGSAAAVTTPAYNGTDTSYTNTGLTTGTDYLYFLSCSGNGYLDSVYGFATGTPAAGFTFTAQSPDNFFQLPLVSTGTYNFTIYVDGSPGDTITTWNDANTDIDLGDTSSHEIELRGTVTGWAFNNAGDKTYIYDISNWGSLKLGVGDASISGFFNGCSNLTISATDTLDLNTTTMRNAFLACSSLISIPNVDTWDWISVTNMLSTFRDSTSFTGGLNDINVSNVTTFEQCFYNCDSMTDTHAGWDVSSATTIDEMYRLSSGANPDPTLWDTSSLTIASNTFQSIGAFDRDLSGWDVSGITTFSNFLQAETLSTTNMDATVISWAAQTVQSSVPCNLGSGTVTGTVADSGTTDGTTANRLVDSTQNFFSTVQIGDGVYNSTDGTYALVTNIVSDTVLQLNNDIMISGEAYTIYNNAAAKAICKLASTYSWTITFGGFV